MRHHGWTLVGICVALAAALALAGENDAKKTPGPPPLKVSKEAPLLLDAAKPSGDASDGPVADNTACFVCHGNFQDEPLAAVHAKANVGCMKCHGSSAAHRNDEDNITPPEIMYPAAKIDAACRKCHEDHNVAAAKVIAQWQKRCPQKTDPTLIHCTDCHGEHRMKVRTVLWNKETGKLLSRVAKKGVATSPTKAGG